MRHQWRNQQININHTFISMPASSILQFFHFNIIIFPWLMSHTGRVSDNSLTGLSMIVWMSYGLMYIMDKYASQHLGGHVRWNLFHISDLDDTTMGRGGSEPWNTWRENRTEQAVWEDGWRLKIVPWSSQTMIKTKRQRQSFNKCQVQNARPT